MSKVNVFEDVSVGAGSKRSFVSLVLQIVISISTIVLFTACEGFKFTGSMCESLQPGQVSTECKAYDDEEAKKASTPKKDDSGECLKCNEAEKLEVHQ